MEEYVWSKNLPDIHGDSVAHPLTTVVTPSRRPLLTSNVTANPGLPSAGQTVSDLAVDSTTTAHCVGRISYPQHTQRPSLIPPPLPKCLLAVCTFPAYCPCQPNEKCHPTCSRNPSTLLRTDTLQSQHQVHHILVLLCLGIIMAIRIDLFGLKTWEAKIC